VANDMVRRGLAEHRDGAVWLTPPEFIFDSIQDMTGVWISLTALDREYLTRMVLLKSDGSPTYHFASVIDDIDCGINLVIRGSDHQANTMKQIAIYIALKQVIPEYAHVGLLHDMDGKKLSKSTGASSLLDFRDSGINSDAMLNFLLRLGWAPHVDDKSAAVIDRDRAKALFLGCGNLRNQSSKVDFIKLNSFHRKYSGRAGIGLPRN
jgi:glutamyl-tRNA synthetase